MSQAMPYIYEAFTEAGIKPEAARKIERAIRTDVANEVAQSHTAMEKGILDRVMTKEDGLQMELRLDKKFDQKIEALSSKMLTTVGLATGFVSVLIVAATAILSAVITLHK